MLPQKRLQSLQAKSALIAQRIESEEKCPSVDQTVLRHLKKQKLEIKEILNGIRQDSAAIH